MKAATVADMVAVMVAGAMVEAVTAVVKAQTNRQHRPRHIQMEEEAAAWEGAAAVTGWEWPQMRTMRQQDSSSVSWGHLLPCAVVGILRWR